MIQPFVKNKKYLISIMGLVVIFSLIPLHFVQAIPIIGDLIAIVANIVTLGLLLPIIVPIIGILLIIHLINIALGIIFIIIVAILSLFIGIFIRIPILEAPVVVAGWTFSRDFVNMFFILILVFIGLATILRIKDYEAKKLLPTLIIIALLINFSSILVGFVVDMGNILTHVFLPEINIDFVKGIVNLTFGWIGDAVREIGEIFTVESIAKGISEFFRFLIQLFITFAIHPIVTIIFYIIAILVYLIVIFIFFVRVIALWILTILAPFAFAAYILPNTRSWWTKWWQSLIQWSFVTVPLAFFLFLSQKIMTGANVFNIPLPPTPPDHLYPPPLTVDTIIETLYSPFVVLIATLLTPLASIIMLLIGIIISFQFTPSSISRPIEGAKKWMSGGLKVAAGVYVGKRLAKYAHRVEERGEKLQESVKDRKGIGAWTKRTIGGMTAMGARELAILGEEQERKRIKTLETKMKDQETKKERISTIKNAITVEEKIAALRVCIAEGEIEDVLKEVSKEDLTKIYKAAEAEGIGLEKNIARALPQFHEDFGITSNNPTDKQRNEFLTNTQDTVIEELQRLKKEDLDELATSGKKKDGQAFTSSVIGELSSEDAKILAKAAQDNEKLSTEDFQTLTKWSDEDLVKKRNKKEREKLIKGIASSPEAIKNMHPDAYTDEELIPLIQKYFGARQISAAAGSSDGARIHIEKIFQDKIDEPGGFEAFAKENPSAAAYFASNASQGAGVVINLKMDEKDAQQIVRNARKSAEEIIKETKNKITEIKEKLERSKTGFTPGFYYEGVERQKLEDELEELEKKLKK